MPSARCSGAKEDSVIEIVAFVLFVILLSRVSEQYTSIPATLFLIVYAYIGTHLFDHLITITKEQFSSILYIMIPIILLPDLLSLSVKEVRKDAGPVLYLAVVAVIFSIIIGSFGALGILGEYPIEFGAWLALFTILMATDAITVSSIFINFSVPHSLKMYAEGESLLNDVTALVIFYFVAMPMLSGEGSGVEGIHVVIVSVIFESVLIGLFFGYAGFSGVKMLKDPIEQFVIIYLIAILAFLTAEHLHVSGILGVIIAVVTFKILIDKELEKNPRLMYQRYRHSEGLAHNNNIYRVLLEIDKYIPTITKKEFQGYKREAYTIGIVANGIVFILMSQVFDITLLSHYIYEILIVFVMTTAIRFGFVHAMFIYLGRPFYWSVSLTLAGVKGALSILMLNSIPESFAYRELFEAVVIGNVILSTFLYTLILVPYIKSKDRLFQKESMQEVIAREDEKVHLLHIRNILEKHSDIKAYNKPFIDQILKNELSRAIRYHLELSIITFRINALDTIAYRDRESFLVQMGEKVNRNIREYDYFGQIEENVFIIVTTNTPLSGANVLAGRLRDGFVEIARSFNDKLSFDFGITTRTPSDDMQTIYEKIYETLERSVYSNKIEIEV